MHNAPHAYACTCVDCQDDDHAYVACEGDHACDADVCPDTPRMNAQTTGRTHAEDVADLRAQLAALKVRVEALERAPDNPLTQDAGGDPQVYTVPGARRCYQCGLAASPTCNSTIPLCDRCSRQ